MIQEIAHLHTAALDSLYLCAHEGRDGMRALRAPTGADTATDRAMPWLRSPENGFHDRQPIDLLEPT